MCEQTAPSAPGASVEGLRLLCSGLELLTGVAPVARPEPVALDLAKGVLEVLGRLQSLALSMIADVDARRLHEADAYASTGTWLVAQGSPLDRSDVALARQYGRLPAVAAAVTAGALPARLASRIGRAVDRVRPFLDRRDGRIDGLDGDEVLLGVIVRGVADLVARARGGFDAKDPALAALLAELVAIWQSPVSQLARVERAMLLLAQRTGAEPAALSRELDQLVSALLPVQLEDAAERGHRARRWQLQLKPDGSGWVLPRGAELDLELGELLNTVIAAMRTVDPDNPTDTTAWQIEHDAQAAADQRARDAASDVDGVADGHGVVADGHGVVADAAGAADAADVIGPVGPARPFGQTGPFGLGLGVATPRPRSQAQRDHDALKLALRALLDSGVLGVRGKTAPHLLITVPAEALNGQPGALPATGHAGNPLAAGLVGRWLLDSRITRLVLSLGRKVIESSHTERTLKAHERLALHVQWGGRCAAAGCTCPPGGHLVPHHATPWATAGTTRFTDSVPFCDTTHHDLHDGQQIVRLRDGRHLGPSGWTDPPDRPDSQDGGDSRPSDDPPT